MKDNNSRSSSTSAASLAFEAKLWQAADVLRNNMDAAEYKHVVLELIFLKYISDAFEAKHVALESQTAIHDDEHADLKADCVLANPPFNDSDRLGEGLKDNKRWVYRVQADANYTWVQRK